MNAEQREILFTRLYLEAYPAVARYIARQGGTTDEAKDIFQDAVVIYYEKMTGKGLQLKQSKEAYLFGIARHLWSRYNKNRQKQLPTISGDADSTPATGKGAWSILALVEHTGRKCLELLHAFYYDRQDMKQLADTFGFSGERSATVQKYKCLEKVRDLVKEKSLVYEDFAD